MAVVDGGNGGSFARVGDGGNASGIGGGKPLPIGVVGWDCELTGEFNWLESPFAFNKKKKSKYSVQVKYQVFKIGYTSWIGLESKSCSFSHWWTFESLKT